MRLRASRSVRGTSRFGARLVGPGHRLIPHTRMRFRMGNPADTAHVRLRQGSQVGPTSALLHRVANVLLADLASLLSHRRKRRFRSEAGDRLGEVLVLRVAALLLDLSVLVAMTVVQTRFLHGFVLRERSLTRRSARRFRRRSVHRPRSAIRTMGLPYAVSSDSRSLSPSARARPRWMTTSARSLASAQ